MWVPLIESGEHLGEGADYFVEKYLTELLACDPLIDTIILGCTHYPFVRSAIRKNFGRPVEIIDGSDGTARQLKRQLENAGLLSHRKADGQVTFVNSRPEMLPKCWELYNLDY